MNKHERRNACRRFNSIFVFSFLVLVLFNILQPKEEYSQLENRYLQKFPELSANSILSGQYMKDMEAYVSDHFAFRNFFVVFKSKMEYLMGKKENNGVYVCKNGYLMEKPKTLNDGLIEQNISAVKTLYNTDRYNVTVSVVPPAYEILKDDLPKNVYRDTILKLNAKLNDAFAGTGIVYADPTELLRKHKDDYLYYRTDHHLTSNGSYVVYHNLAKTLGYTPLSGDDFKISDVSREFLGTTYSKSLKKTTPDVICDYRPLETPRFKVKFPYEGTEADSMYFPAHLKEKDKYSYFLDGNHALTVIESPNKNGKNLVVLKDSYAHSIVPFLANHFETIHMIDLRYYNDDIIKYMGDNDVKDVLFLYSASSFMSDETIQKTAAYAENSAYLNQGVGMVFRTKPVGDGYFKNTAFIGDSLTDGLKDYANLPDAEFLCGTSMTIDALNTRQAPGGGTIMDRIQQGGFEKVYIMLGANEYVVESNKEKFIKKYGALIDTVKTHNPGAIVYIQSILPVSEQEQESGYLKNDEIKRYNQALLALAEEKEVYYIDVTRAVTDDKGNLISGSNTDGTHLNKEYYLKWLDYLKTHTVGASAEDGTGGESEEELKTDIDVKGLAQMVLQNVAFHDSLGEISRRVLYASYGLDESMLVNAAGYRGGGATAEEIAVFEVKDEGDGSKVKQKAKDYIESRKNSFQNYIPEEMPKLNRPFIYANDKLVVVCIADDYGKLESKIKAFIK